MPDPLAKLHALAAESIARLPGAPGSAQWAKAFERALATAHTAAYYAATAERLGVSVGTLKGLSRAERGDVKRAVGEQVSYLKKFVGDTKDMSEAAIAARAKLYAGSVVATYSQARWGDWALPFYPTQGSECMVNCRCSWQVEDNNDGTGSAVWKLSAAEHCVTCKTRANDSPYQVKRRAP